MPFFSSCELTPNEGDDSTSAAQAQEMIQAMMGPQAVDEAVRRAIQMCWMMLPQGRKTMDAVEAEIRRLVDRALANMREDSQKFGISEVEQKRV
jgi:hypothetical protein